MAITKVSPGLLDLDSGITISTADNTNTLTLISTDADASSGPNLRLYRNSGSPANNDFLANIKYVGRNDNSQDVEYAEQEYYITDKSDGAEDGLANFNVMTNGTALSYLQMRGETGQLIVNEASADIDFRVESDVNSNAFYLDGATGVIGLGFANTTAANQLHILGTSSVPSVNISLQTNDTANARAGITLMSRKADNVNVNATLINHTTALQSSLGISFGSDTAAANALDDYEEGTWTPAWTATTSTVHVNSAVYTKIGNLVTVHAYIQNISPATSGDQQQITGLPFPVAGSSHYGVGHIVYSVDGDVEGIGILAAPGSSYLYFHYIDGTTASSVSRNNWNSIKSSGLALIFTATYRVA